jgi:hypothetical protein
MDGQGQYFATPKIPNLAGAITKGHATSPETMHYNRGNAVLFETGFCSVVFHSRLTKQNQHHGHEHFLPFL